MGTGIEASLEASRTLGGASAAGASPRGPVAQARAKGAVTSPRQARRGPAQFVLTRQVWRLSRRMLAMARGLHGRVLLLCFLTAAPLLGLLAVAGLIDHGTSLRNAESRVAELARIGAAQEIDVVAEAGRVLRTLAEVPAIRDMQSNACYNLTRAVAEADPRIDIITVDRPDGVMVCSSAIERPNVFVKDRAYFNRAMEMGPTDAPVTELVISRTNGKPTIMAAVPLPFPTGSGPNAGVIAAALSLDWLSQVAARIPDEADHMAIIVDPHDGQVLARSPPAQSGTPQRLSTSLIGAMRASDDHGAIEARSTEGVDWIYGFAPLHVDNRNLLLVIGLSRDGVLAQARTHIRIGAFLALAAMLGTVVIGWGASKAFLLKPIAALAAAVARLGSGELSTRAPVLRQVGELRALGVAFNRMAGRLQARDRQLAQMRVKLQVSEEHHRLLADNASDMITRFSPDFIRTYVSPACRELLGYTPEDLVGLQPGGIVHPDDWLVLDATLNAPLLAGHETARATYRALRKDGRCIWLESTGRRLPAGQGFVVVTRDVSERKAFEQRLETANRQLEDLARHDALTGLINRRQFDVLLESECRRAARLGMPLGALIVDVDRFKAYNDAFGHPAGDVCLRAVAGAIDSVLRRPGDVAARLGGEEFGILLPGTDDEGTSRMAQRVCDAVRALGLAHPEGEQRMVTISVGAAVMRPHDSGKGANLIERADKALYTAKREGRNTVRMAGVIPPG